MRALAQEITTSYDERVEGVKQSRKDAQAQLKEFDEAHRAMAQELRSDLGKVKPALAESEAARREDEAQRAQGRAQVVAQHKSEVKAWMGEVASDHAGARAEWQKMASTMRTRRAGVPGPEGVPGAQEDSEEPASGTGRHRRKGRRLESA